MKLGRVRVDDRDQVVLDGWMMATPTEESGYEAEASCPAGQSSV